MMLFISKLYSLVCQDLIYQYKINYQCLCMYLILQPTASHQDILVPLVISHVHPVPLAVNVLEIVLDYVLPKSVTIFSDVKKSPLLYLKQPIQVWNNLITEFIAYVLSHFFFRLKIIITGRQKAVGYKI